MLRNSGICHLLTWTSVSILSNTSAVSSTHRVNPVEIVGQAGVLVNVGVDLNKEEGLILHDQSLSSPKTDALGSPSPVHTPSSAPSQLLDSVSNASSAPTPFTVPLAPVPSVPSVTPDNAASALIPLATSTLILNDGNTEPTRDPRVMDVVGLDQAMSPALASPATPAKAASVPGPPTTSTLNNGSTEQTPNPHPMDVDEVNGTMSPSALTLPTDAEDDKTVPMDVDRASGTKDSTSSLSTDVDNPSKLPAWLTSNGMLGYLCGISAEKAWQQLISSFFKFEMANTITGVHKCFLLANYHLISDLFYRTYLLLAIQKRSRHGSTTRRRTHHLMSTSMHMVHPSWLGG